MSELLSAIQSIKDAISQMDCFPDSIITEDGKERKRDSYGDGWNACWTKMFEKIWDRLSLLEKEGIDENFALLSLLDVGWVSEDGDEFDLNMNDTFFFATSDVETLNKEEAKEVIKLIKRHGFKGMDYWVAQKRGYDPEIPRYAKRVEEVRALEEQKSDK